MSDALEREIRDLRSLYWSDDRDPEGRAFAPLADACRRAGDLDEALELIQDGVDRHPDFSPGHLVAAWVFFDRGDAIEAESAFRRVLELDGDNASAIHGLGRILAARGEEEGVEMVLRAQELDPTLRRRGRTVAPDPAPKAAPEPEPMVVEEPEAEEEDEVVMDLGALAPDEPEVVEEPEAEEEDEFVMDLAALAPDEPEMVEEPEAEEEDEFVMDLGALAPDEPEVVEEPEAEEDDEVVMDLAALAPDEPEMVEEPEAEEDDEVVMDLAALAPDEPEVVEEPEAEEDDEVVMDLGALAPDEPEVVEEPEAEEEDEFVMDLAALAPDEPEVVEEPDAEAELAAAAPAPAPTEPEVDDYYASDEEEAEANAPLDEAELAGQVVTRTMAELFARQGMTTRAVQIYEQLVGVKPDDEGLAARLEELRPIAREEEGRAAAPDAPDPSTAPGAPASHDEVAEMIATSDSHPHGETPFAWIGEADDHQEEPAAGGAPVNEYFSGLLSWKTAAGEAPPAAAAGVPAAAEAPADSDTETTEAPEASDDEPADPDTFFDAWGGGS